MSLIQRCCWVGPKQKAWLCSPPLMLGRTCWQKFPQQPLACSELSPGTDGFGDLHVLGDGQPHHWENSFPLPPPATAPALRSQNGLGWKGHLVPSPSCGQGCNLMWPCWVQGRGSPGPWSITSCWWRMWGEQEMLLVPDTGLCPSPDLAAQFPGPKGSPACAQRKICSFRKNVPCTQFESNLETLKI